ncbi:hypothetical protein [Fodinibius sp.]|uniref:hypothetical protein n=1 Tax=Fodinibius sp. TaxID=1872440 RepID=UPI002ACDA6D5|nr:hypothetical protein [Fodinibius sp.]MDZ7657883.1 hypothetical protein [Fodinibius sp.]
MSESASVSDESRFEFLSEVEKRMNPLIKHDTNNRIAISRFFFCSFKPVVDIKLAFCPLIIGVIPLEIYE